MDTLIKTNGQEQYYKKTKLEILEYFRIKYLQINKSTNQHSNSPESPSI